GVTIKSSADGTATVSGVGKWKVNDSTVTLSHVSSLISGESGLEVLEAGAMAYETAKLSIDEDDIYYDNGSDDIIIQGDDKGENVAIIGNNASGDKIIMAGSGGDSIENYSSKAEVTMIGGAGDDYIVATSGPNEYIDLAKGGKDTITALNTDTLTVHNYDAKTGATFLTNTSENLTNLIMYGDPYLLVVGDGYFKADNLGRVELSGTDTLNGTFVNFHILNENKTQLYGWSGQAGGNVDGSDYTDDAIIIGVAPSGYSTMKGGSGNDTIYAAADDVVNLSGGNDLIDIDHLDREWRINGNIGGVTINLGNGNINSNATIKSFDSSVDKITVDGVDDISFEVVNGNLRLEKNNTSLTFKDIAETTNLLINDEEISFIADDSALTVNADSVPAEFYGTSKTLNDEKLNNGSTVDYSNYDYALNVNMNDNFHNIEAVKGGRGKTTLWGSEVDNNALYAGHGETSIYGGAGGTRDSLFGYAGDDKTGGATFFMLEGSGLDTISGFEFGTSATSDKIHTFGEGITSYELVGDELRIQVGADYDDQMIIEGAANEVLQINAWNNDYVVEVGDNFKYDDAVQFYLNKSGSATITADGAEDVAIYANGFDGKAYDNITNINASSATGKATLVGADGVDNVIIGGSGNNSLWGGSYTDENAGDDTLIGSTGSNEFFYLKGNGNDVIQNIKSDDLINLLDITLEDITSMEITNSGINVKLNDGGSLQVNSNTDVTFQLADGNKWQSNHLNRNWIKK
ncbi:MAG: hypothetical protein IJ563_04265, partial [Selenomonadaceae bacterium]|nr:hypothetical protein [Selenomonadaceae bacterium]